MEPDAHSTSNVSIFLVTTSDDLKTVIGLFEAYSQSLGIDLTFQDFATEMASMPGKYAPPKGALFLAKDNEGHALGCVGLRPLAPQSVCEMKRLYVAPVGRGLGIGGELAAAAIAEAKRLAYRAMRLDTLPSMVSALGLYKKLGFLEIEAYYATPLEGTKFLELGLSS